MITHDCFGHKSHIHSRILASGHGGRPHRRLDILLFEPVTDSLLSVAWSIVILEYKWVAWIPKHVDHRLERTRFLNINALLVIHVSLYNGKFPQAMDANVFPHYYGRTSSGLECHGIWVEILSSCSPTSHLQSSEFKPNLDSSENII